MRSFPDAQEEIDQISINEKGSFIAIADDSGTVRVFDYNAEAIPFRTIRKAHKNVCLFGL